MFPRWSTGSCFTLQALGSPLDLDVRLARRLLHNILLYISSTVKPTYSWVYQTIQPSQYTIGFIRPSTNNKCTYINNTLISTMHLYQQPIIIQANTVGFIRPSTITHALISTVNDHLQVSFPAVSSNSTTPYNTRDHSLLCSSVPRECLLLYAL